MQSDIESIINPQSIAVVGASNRKGSVGHAVISNLLHAGYTGVVYPVNPKSRSVLSIRTYHTVSDIPDEIDLVVIIIPAKAVAATLEEAGKKGTKGAVVITAGFKEGGDSEGIDLEKKISKVAKKYNIRMVGPNCLGVINTNPDVVMNASFATKMPLHGNIAFISQSGALCTAVLDYADGRRVGFSKFISFGNKADVNEIDLLNYLKDDSDTHVIIMYLEDISNGREFLETAREIVWDAGKPILAIKSGRSPEGAKAASSHTGSLAGSDNSYNAIFKQSGILRVEGVDELFNYAIALSKQPIPNGNRLAFITNAGGPGIMATDAAIRHDLKLAKLSGKTKEKLKEVLPPTAAINNPVDVIGDATHVRYKNALQIVLKDRNVDAVIIILSPQAMTDILETAKVITQIAHDESKTILCAFMGTVDVSEGAKYLLENGVPNYIFPEAAVRSFAALVQYRKLLGLKQRQIRTRTVDRNKAHAAIRKKLEGKNSYYMGESEANELLSMYGFPVLKSTLITCESKVTKAGETVGYPVAMKIMSPNIVHKFDAGGVQLKIKSDEEAIGAYNKILNNAKAFNPNAHIEGILMERMAKKGVEVILGAVKDPKFGPLCMFGLGGTFVEALKDVTFRMAPMWEVSAEIMIKDIKAYRILQGVRGAPPSDIESIKDCIIRLSQMLNDHPEIAELDINPLIVYAEGEGCVVADSRVMLREPEV